MYIEYDMKRMYTWVSLSSRIRMCFGMKCPSTHTKRVHIKKTHQQRVRTRIMELLMTMTTAAATTLPAIEPASEGDEQRYDIKAFLELANGSFNHLPRFKTHQLLHHWIESTNQTARSINWNEINPYKAVTHFITVQTKVISTKIRWFTLKLISHREINQNNIKSWNWVIWSVSVNSTSANRTYFIGEYKDKYKVQSWLHWEEDLIIQSIHLKHQCGHSYSNQSFNIVQSMWETQNPDRISTKRNFTLARSICICNCEYTYDLVNLSLLSERERTNEPNLNRI